MIAALCQNINTFPENSLKTAVLNKQYAHK